MGRFRGKVRTWNSISRGRAHVLTGTIVLAARGNVWRTRRNTRVRLSVLRPGPTTRRRDTHVGPRGFMNDELIWDVTRAVDS